MKPTTKALITKDLNNALANLSRAKKTADLEGDWRLSKSLTAESKQLSNLIAQLNDTPNLTMNELLG